MPVILEIAMRNIFRNGRRSAITLLAVGLGVSLLILFMGFRVAFLDWMVEGVVLGKTGALQIHKTGFMADTGGNPSDHAFSFSDEEWKKALAVPGVKALSGRIFFMGTLSDGKNQAIVLAKAIDPEKERGVCPKLQDSLAEGSPLPDGPGITLGKDLAPLFSNDTLILSGVSPEGRANSLDVKRTGELAPALPFENKKAILTSLSEAQALLGMAHRYTEIAVAVSDLESLDETRLRLAEAIGPQFEVHDWVQVQPIVRDMLFRQKVVLAVVALVLSFITLFVIANTMLMTVYERLKEIGTLMSLGARKKQIIWLFLGEGALLGFFGSIGGAVFGHLLVATFHNPGLSFGEGPGAVVLHLGTYFPFSFSVILGAILGSALSSLWPASLAASLNPSEISRS